MVRCVQAEPRPPFSTCWPPPGLARIPPGVSTRALQRRGDANAAAMQQEAGQDCGNFTPAHVVCNRTTPPGAIEALRATLFNPMKDTVEDLRVPHIRNVENGQQMTH